MTMTDTYRIKALEWEQDESVHSAASLYGCYFVFIPTGELGRIAKHVVNGVSYWREGYFDSIQSAKAACEQHWHETIKQALEKEMRELAN